MSPSPPSPLLPSTSEISEKLGDGRGLFFVIEQLAALEGALWNILDGLKSNATHVSYFCREYWGTSSSQAQLSLEKLGFNERLKRQVQQASVLESLSLGVASQLCSGTMQNVSVTIRARLRNLLYYVHENCLVLLDLICQRWQTENPITWDMSKPKYGHCPENLNLDVLVRVKRYRALRRGEHLMALRQHNEMIANVVRQLCRGATTKKVPLTSRSTTGDRSPGRGFGVERSVLPAVNEVLASRVPLDRLRPSAIRQRMISCIRFEALVNETGDPDCPWPPQDPYKRYGSEQFPKDGTLITFEPLPPMLPNLDLISKLPPHKNADVYTLVLDLDETLVHYSEHDGMGSYEIRPGMYEFIQRMHRNGYEIVIFTAATQDYADWVIDQIDPERLIHHRLYRQHALPWGPIFVKDLSRIGRDLDRTLIIDNVQENFMLQPHNGIFILSWYDDPKDTALFALTPLLDELITTKSKVHEILEKYKNDIPLWAGFDSYDVHGDFSEFDPSIEDGGYIHESGMHYTHTDPPHANDLPHPTPIAATTPAAPLSPPALLSTYTSTSPSCLQKATNPISAPASVAAPAQTQLAPQLSSRMISTASVASEASQSARDQPQQRSQASSFSPQMQGPSTAQQPHSYQPQPLPSPYLPQRTQSASYPPQGQTSQSPASRQPQTQQLPQPPLQVQQQFQPQMQRPQGPPQAVQKQPQIPAMQVQQAMQRPPGPIPVAAPQAPRRPAFSNVSGPYQAAPPPNAAGYPYQLHRA
jgi:Dullard-like phosphatase family protein